MNHLLHPEGTAATPLWREDGVVWNVDVVNGGERGVRVYGRRIDASGVRILEWVVETRENDLPSLISKLTTEAGADASTPRPGPLLLASLSVLVDDDWDIEDKDDSNAGLAIDASDEFVELVVDDDDDEPPVGGGDPIKDIKGNDPNLRGSEPDSCTIGDAANCNQDLDLEYPRIAG